MTFSPGDVLITLRTCGDLRRGDVVTVSGTCADGEYLYLDGYERQAYRSDAFMVAVRRPWHAWADPEWDRRAREAAERFVREGIVIEATDPDPRDADLALAPVATVAMIRAQAFEYIAQRLEAKARAADLGATFWHGSLHGTSIYNFFTYAADEVRALAEKETSR